MKEFWTGAFAKTFSSLYAGFDVKFVLFALLAAIVLLVLMRATGLMRRNARWHRVLVCLYYLYIPAVFIGCGMAWSSLGSADHAVMAAINEARPAITRTSADYASSAWKSVVDTFRKQPDISLRDMCLTLAREYAAELMDGFSASKYTAFLKPVVAGIQEGVAVTLATAVEESALKKIADTTKLDKELLRTFWTTDVVAAMQGGLVCDIIAHQAKKAFAPFYFKIKLIFALLMLPVALETAWSVYRRRRQAS